MRNLIPTIALLAAAGASAQTASRNYGTAPYGSNDLGRPERFEIALTPSYGTISDPYRGIVDDQSGFGLDAQFHLPSVFFLKAGIKSYSDVDAYVFGLGFAIPAGNGRVTINLDGTALDFDGWGTEYQSTIRVAYDHRFAFGLRLGVGVSEFLNSNAVGENVTAPTFTVGYKFGAKGPALELTYSNKDAILGLPESGHSFNTSLTFAF